MTAIRPPGRKPPDLRTRRPRSQHLELVVDLDAQRLECPARRVRPVRRAAAGIAFLMTLDELTRGCQRVAAPRGYDECCDARGPPFLTVLAKDAT